MVKANMKPKVSVVIPFYAGAEWLKQAIESVYEGTYDSFEVIVVNDGSEEDIEPILKMFDDRIVYIKQQNSGPAVARNKGIEVAQGKYVAFLDSDDYWEKEKLELQVQLMEEQGVVWSHTAYANFEDGTDNHKRIDVSHIRGDIYPWCMYSNRIATPCVIVKTQVLKETGFGFESDMRFGQDAILWFRLASLFEIGLVDDCLAHVRKNGSNVSQNVKIQLLARGQLWRKIKCFDKECLEKVRGIGRLSYIWCEFVSRPMKAAAKEATTPISKLLSIIFYAPAYIGFKLASKKWGR